MASWRAAYQGTDQPSDDLIYWHDRWAPGTTSRLLGPTGILINCGKAKQHREPNLAGAPRHQFDHTGVPPSRNTPPPTSLPGPQH